MFRNDRGVDAAAHVEFGSEPQETRLQRRGEAIRNLVGHRFVKGAAIAERPDVGLERLELDTTRIRHVFEVQDRKIRLSRERAQAGEFRQPHADRVIAFRLADRKGFDVARWRQRHMRVFPVVTQRGG